MSFAGDWGTLLGVGLGGLIAGGAPIFGEARRDARAVKRSGTAEAATAAAQRAQALWQAEFDGVVAARDAIAHHLTVAVEADATYNIARYSALERSALDAGATSRIAVSLILDNEIRSVCAAAASALDAFLNRCRTEGTPEPVVLLDARIFCEDAIDKLGERYRYLLQNPPSDQVVTTDDGGPS